ncbi:YcnI family protein [Bacillus songklensis]|uniref:YcnI family protein n=1 Tax=Bacillus songklensis TaxID=1069116 RepID=A0ABV8B3X5_9BACI
MKNILKKSSTAIISTMTAMALFAGTASAHVTVNPSTSAPGAWETYTVKVPVEKEVPTTKVTVKIPKGLEYKQYEPVPGWTTTTEKDGSGNVTSITWTAIGEGILPGQFQRFTFVAKNPDKEQEAAWDAYQYYKDNSIVEWTGDEESESPHSITNITTAPASGEQQDTGHHADHDDAVKDTAAATESGDDGTQTTTMVLSIIALLLSIGALILGLRRKK